MAAVGFEAHRRAIALDIVRTAIIMNKSYGGAAAYEYLSALRPVLCALAPTLEINPRTVTATFADLMLAASAAFETAIEAEKELIENLALFPSADSATAYAASASATMKALLDLRRSS